MKKTIILFAIFFSCFSLCKAQSYVLYGMTTQNGSHNLGTIFTYDITAKTCTAVFNFDSTSGIWPDGSLTFDPNNGLLYGVTSQGGTNNTGVLFSFDPVKGKDSVYFSFSKAAGQGPGYGSLLLYNNWLYGMNPNGGKYGYGYVFGFNTITGKDSIVINFDGTKGGYPAGVDFTAYNNLLYGMTTGGGAGSNGTIFSYNPITGKDSIYLSLSSTVGKTPYEGGLTLNPKNHLMYALTYAGGLANDGTILSFNPVTNKDSLVYTFGSQINDGKNPYGSLLYDTADGMLYGMTYQGGSSSEGTIFRYNPVTGKDTTLVNFNSFNGTWPYGDLILGPNNTLYGMTSNGNAGNGLLFSYNTVTKKDTVLFNFTNASGIYPYGSLLMLKKGSVTNISAISQTIKEIRIYPNPFNGMAIISFTESGIHYLEIFDMAGRKINSTECNGIQYQLNCKGFATGVYFIRVYDKEHNYLDCLKAVMK